MSDAIFWTCRDSEQLRCETVDEAVEEHLEMVLYDRDPSDWPETVTARGFKRGVVTYDGETVLERMLEHLDEEYSDPDGDDTKPTEGMKRAADAFVSAVLAEYTPWACEECETVTVNVKEWVTEHMPEWLTAEVQP